MAGYLLSLFIPGTGHSYPQPLLGPVLLCLHGNATVFAPRPPISQDQLKPPSCGGTASLQPEAPHPTIPPLLPSVHVSSLEKQIAEPSLR